MSAPDTDIIMTLTISGRRFQVLILHEPPTTWFGTISQRTDNQGHTRPLGSVETQDGPDVALQGALDHILQAVGFTSSAEREQASVGAPSWTAASARGASATDARQHHAPTESAGQRSEEHTSELQS